MVNIFRISAAASLAALLSLSGCNNEPEVVANGDPQAEELAKAPPVELPPAIQASHTYRCKDNSLVYVDFYTDNTANVRLGSREAAPTKVTAPETGSAYTAEGYSLSGNGKSITIAAPGKGSQAFNA